MQDLTWGQKTYFSHLLITSRTRQLPKPSTKANGATLRLKVASSAMVVVHWIISEALLFYFFLGLPALGKPPYKTRYAVRHRTFTVIPASVPDTSMSF